MKTYSDIELQKLFAFTDEVCARDSLQKQFNILNLHDIILPEILFGSIIEIPFKYFDLLNSFIKYNYPFLGLKFIGHKIIESDIQTPILQQQDNFETTIEVTEELTDDSINLKDIHTELKILRIDSKNQIEKNISSNKSNTELLINTLSKINIDLNNIISEQTKVNKEYNRILFKNNTKEKIPIKPFKINYNEIIKRKEAYKIIFEKNSNLHNSQHLYSNENGPFSKN